MRRALIPTTSTAPIVIPTSFQAPVGGWNARDAVAEMPIQDAVILDNFFPRATDVRPRPGTSTYASGLGSQVETLFSYNGGAALKLFCAVGTIIQNINTVSASGTIPSSSTIATGFTNARWQYINITTAGGNYMMAANGADARQIYDGTTWYAASIASGSISTVTNLALYQRRIFYTQSDSLSFAYHDNVNAIGGTITSFPLGTLCQLGGYLMGVATWTRDGGDGMDDYISFITNRGEVVVYQGIDPGSASTWVLNGVYRIPEPMSYRSFQKYGGDLLILTKAGLLPMSVVLSGVSPQAFITDKIRNAIADGVRLYGTHYGWEVAVHPGGQWLMINVPVETGDYQDQYVMNSQTGSWCRFRAMKANCWAVHNSLLYYGSNGKVIKADTGTNDDGADVSIGALQASSHFGMPGRQKHFKMFKPLISSDSALAIAFGFNVDFGTSEPTNIPSATPVSFAEWDVATWDDYYWADIPLPVGTWQSPGVIGSYGAVHLAGAVNTETLWWYGTDIVFEPGGIL